MKTAAMVLGLVGGIIGVVIALAVAPFTFGLSGGGLFLVIIPVGAGACGIMGGAMARTEGPVAWSLMVAGALAGALVLRWLWVLPLVLLLTGAGLRMAVKDEPSEGTA